MRKLVFLLALIAAVAFEAPAKKSPCTWISPTGVCFNEAWIAGRCQQHLLSTYPNPNPTPCSCPPPTEQKITDTTR